MKSAPVTTIHGLTMATILIGAVFAASVLVGARNANGDERSVRVRAVVATQLAPQPLPAATAPRHIAAPPGVQPEEPAPAEKSVDPPTASRSFLQQLGFSPIHDLSIMKPQTAVPMPASEHTEQLAALPVYLIVPAGFDPCGPRYYRRRLSAFCHYPVCLEQRNAERHGRTWGLFQPAVSAAHFFGRLPTIPYCLGSRDICSRSYPGSCYDYGYYAPRVRELPPLRLDGSLLEAGALTGVLLLFP